MTIGRLIHFVAVTALASGVLAASVIAKAQGEQNPIQTTGSEGVSSTKPAAKKRASQSRKTNHSSASANEITPPEAVEASAEVEKRAAIRIDKPAPLPPHRPDTLGAESHVASLDLKAAPSEAVKPPLQQLSSYSAPSVQRFEPYPVAGTSSPKIDEADARSGDEQEKQTSVKEQSSKQVVASVPLPPIRPLSAVSSDNEAFVAAGVTDPVPDSTEVVSANLTGQVPIPPVRPDLPEMQEQAEVPANVQLASYQPLPAQDGGQNLTGEKSPNWLERLFSAPSGTDTEPSNAQEQPRGLSKLNRIIGDDPVRATKLRPLISRHAAENGIPFGLADAVVRIESRYNSAARNGPYMGLMQIHHRTARSLGYNGDASGLFDADTNLRYGIKYLAMAYRLAGGDTCGTILRYQAGHRATSMTLAARNYCSKVKMIHAELTR